MAEKDEQELIDLIDEVEEVPTTTSVSAETVSAQPARAGRKRQEPVTTDQVAEPVEAEVPAEVPPEHPLLSADEIQAAKDRARRKLEEARRKSALEAVEKDETERLKREEGLVTGDGVKDQMVKITLDLANHSDKILINGTPYWHGFTYTVPRHVADTMREIQARGWAHQDEIDGKSRAEHYQAQRKSLMAEVGVSGKTGVHKGGLANYGLRAGPEDHARAS